MVKFEINQKGNGEFHFNFKVDNSNIVLSSEGHLQKVTCMDSIRSVKRNAHNDSHFDKKVSTDGKHYFNLKASNGQVIGTSELYECEQSMHRGIDIIKSHAPTASVKDLT